MKPNYFYSMPIHFLTFENIDLSSFHIYICVCVCIQCVCVILCPFPGNISNKEKEKHLEKLSSTTSVQHNSIIQVNDKKTFQNMKVSLEPQNSRGREAPMESFSPDPLFRSGPLRAGCSRPCPGAFWILAGMETLHPVGDLFRRLTLLTVKMFYLIQK